ncbi:circadian clock protein [cyanobacterium endosymbiont of Rhopalodia gibberula]|uniref:circadian clock protein KaiA n=1 Tax=cyanobacterium endosymbiont of Rhopalodia gibberula TaxID=1763363 RepID=UPI000DC6E75A|nr:circadian clock protein KaiA [cyanobacterium endosymbiont of Rhopalodia gibberula]BBA78899.1 circadian clock protein [cyanobacterium endosymbiont of Rhopalodia gibberula]
MQSRLSICLYISNHHIAQDLTSILSNKSYSIQLVYSSQELLDLVNSHDVQIDCLVIFRDTTVSPLFNQLYEQGTLLPVVIIEPELDSEVLLEKVGTLTCLYHSAEVRQLVTTLDDIDKSLELAIAQFLRLGPSCSLVKSPVSLPEALVPDKQLSFLLLQQRRLAEKLKERLGYLGVFYKRNPKHFFRNISKIQQEELIKHLTEEYRKIILNYFSNETEINQFIDQFVNKAFFADIAISKILEIHMELIDEFSQQLKIEGRSDEILLDYRLTIIDILAHLGEMYRRSVPRENLYV